MKRLPTLSDYDTANRDDYETMQSGSWNKGRGVVRVGPASPTPISAGSITGKPTWCWCGEYSGHYWPGQDEGASHPR